MILKILTFEIFWKIREFVDDNLVDKKLEGREIVDPVWLFTEYKPKVYEIEEAIAFHKELAQPEMLNNLNGFLQVRLLLDMSTKKKSGWAKLKKWHEPFSAEAKSKLGFE